MTMEDRTDDASVASFQTLYTVMYPALKELGDADTSAAQTLRAAFLKAESENPGLTQDIVLKILEKKNIKVSHSEALLRMGADNVEEFSIHVPAFRELNKKVQDLNRHLSRIPDSINDKTIFLQIIKDIAGCIKELLDAVAGILKKYKFSEEKPLQQQKKEFVKCAKSFSDSLKTYFKDGNAKNLFVSTNHLAHRANMILKVFKNVAQ